MHDLMTAKDISEAVQTKAADNNLKVVTEIVIDLGETKRISQVGAGFLQDENSWIFMPQSVTFEGSRNGKKYKLLGTVNNDISPKQSGGIVKDFVVEDVDKRIRFLRVKAKSLGACPTWHKGAGNPCWIFADEIWAK